MNKMPGVILLSVSLSLCVGVYYGDYKGRMSVLAGMEGSEDLSCAETKALREELALLKSRMANTVMVAISEPEPEPKPKEEPAVEENKPASAVPVFFTSFRAEFEVISKEPEGRAYALKQAKELRGLVRTVPTVQDVKVIRIQGGAEKDGKTMYYTIFGDEE